MQIFKEYLEFKTYLVDNVDNFQKSADEFAKMQLESQDIDFDAYFDKVGIYKVLQEDYSKHVTKLYHYYHAYKDFIEIPNEIQEEIDDIDIVFIFEVKDGQHKVVNKKLLDNIKNSFINFIGQQVNEE